MDTDVIVIGAGLAGLRCAATLKSQGYQTVILEAASSVGGRVKTENHDGFLCDVGFQLLNPAYPLAQRHLDLGRLALGSFDAGVQVRTFDGHRIAADPRRSPRWVAATLRSKLWSPLELKGMLELLGPVLSTPESSRKFQDMTWTDAMESAGLNGALRHQVLEPFLAGVLADWSGSTRADVVLSLLRFFVLGSPGLPREGMQSIPNQLAEPLREDLRLGHKVVDIQHKGSGVDVVTDQGTVSARMAVCTTGLESVPVSSGLTSAATPHRRGLSTWWFSAAHANSRAKLLAVDGRRDPAHAPGPLVNAAVVSAAQPSYAPHGRHLIQASAVRGVNDPCPSVDEVMVHASDMLGLGRASWEHITTHHVPHSLPSFTPDGRKAGDMWLTDRIAQAGDFTDSPSLQGAMAAGNKVGQSVANRLAAHDGHQRAKSLAS